MARHSFLSLLLVGLSVLLTIAAVEARVLPKSSRLKSPAPRGLRDIVKPAECMTNAKRFAAGLPPLPPTRRTRRSALRPRQSNSPEGLYQIIDQTTGQVLGQTGALFNANPGGSVTHGVLTSDGGYVTAYAFNGAQNIVPGSTDWVQVDIEIPSPAPDFSTDRPQPRDGSSVYEVANWDLDPSTGSLTFTWINSDGTPANPQAWRDPQTGIVYVTYDNSAILAQGRTLVAVAFHYQAPS
ncbi:hypothetical protein FRB99_000134 [Tulasnella sp. 403]|nr:hypothetical protein FRB99_000134 [Tulasnella sp. 403]